MSTRVWNLLYRAGTANRVISSADNPVTRKVALDGAAVVTKNGWRVWVEHHTTGAILYQNPAEQAYQQTLAADQDAAKANSPDFARQRHEQA